MVCVPNNGCILCVDMGYMWVTAVGWILLVSLLLSRSIAGTAVLLKFLTAILLWCCAFGVALLPSFFPIPLPLSVLVEIAIRSLPFRFSKSIFSNSSFASLVRLC